MGPLSEKLTEQDWRQIRAAGIREETLEFQLRCLTQGVSPIVLDRPCRVGDGIQALDASEATRLAQLFEKEVQGPGRASKFVPASGAATRMFAPLLSSLASRTSTPELNRFIAELNKFPFADELGKIASPRQEPRAIVEALLHESGLGYAHMPKGLIPFHRYPEGTRTAFEEQLHEAEGYIRDGKRICRIHFAVPSEWRERIAHHLQAASRGIPGVQWELAFSQQKPSTRTLALDPEGNPFRDSDGSLLLRPGGHGALLENLSDWRGDIVFIKNIDNVLPDRLQAEHQLSKKALGGVLIEMEQRLFSLLRRISGGEDSSWWPEARQWAKQFGRVLPDDFKNRDRKGILQWFRRPIRVCGMVKNQGEPGGGPFWVREKDGSICPQIVESSQWNAGDPAQARIFRGSTHFNPVDLACSLKDFEGRPFQLESYVDSDAVFISEKTHQGRPLKALEWPGLWNGAMSGWFTVFVEVPVSTFNPVKTVMDLLRPEHQA